MRPFTPGTWPRRTVWRCTLMDAGTTTTACRREGLHAANTSVRIKGKKTNHTHNNNNNKKTLFSYDIQKTVASFLQLSFRFSKLLGICSRKDLNWNMMSSRLTLVKLFQTIQQMMAEILFSPQVVQVSTVSMNKCQRQCVTFRPACITLFLAMLG